MKLQQYYPSTHGEQIAWLKSFQLKFPGYAATLRFEQSAIDAALADLAWLICVLSQLQPRARTYAVTCTSLAKHLVSGKGNMPVLIPPFDQPELPEGIAPVKPGALRRIFKLIIVIKNTVGYTNAMGTDLNIVGDLHKTDSPVPTFKLSVIHNENGECVKIGIRRFGRDYVTIESLRGDGEWEDLGMTHLTSFLDERPLLDPTRPEVRQYRLRFWHSGHPSGDWTLVSRITVSPQ